MSTLDSEMKNIKFCIQQDTKNATLFSNSTAETATPSEVDPEHRK
jgi:hypothetical protein